MCGKPGISPAPLTLPLVFIVLAILCGVFTLAGQYLRPAPTIAILTFESLEAPLLVKLPSSILGPRFVRAALGEGKSNDLYLYASTSISEPVNLTRSPAINEVWPVPDSNGEHVAYYGINGTDIEVYLLYIDRSRAPLPLTVKAGNSALHNGFEITPTLAPSFSPSQTWVAFPAHSGNGDVVEVFIAQTDGQQVVRATTLNQQVVDYVWLDNDTLIVTYQLGRQRLAFCGIPAEFQWPAICNSNSIAIRG